MIEQTTKTEVGKATREQLRELHFILTETLLLYMQTTAPAKRRAGMLEVVRAFLKDNGITKNLDSSREVSKTLEALNDVAVPFLPDYLTTDNLN